MAARPSLLVVLSVVYVDMLGLGLAFPVLPRLIEQCRGSFLVAFGCAVRWFAAPARTNS